MQFGFKKGVGCTEASFTILDTINHMLERVSKGFWVLFRHKKGFEIQSGFTVYFINYFPNSESEDTCGLPSKWCKSTGTLLRLAVKHI